MLTFEESVFDRLVYCEIHLIFKVKLVVSVAAVVLLHAIDEALVCFCVGAADLALHVGGSLEEETGEDEEEAFHFVDFVAF